MLWREAMILRLITFCFMICSVACAQIIPPDVQVSLDRIDPLNGKTVWTTPFDRAMRPYRCELYTNRVVAFLYAMKDESKADATTVVFLNAGNGQRVAPFDTRDFVWPDEDPQIARSGNGSGGSQGSVEEERSELSLPNGWRSHGVAALSWHNAGSNDIYFFGRSQLQWIMTLPEGAYNLSHWNNILVFSRVTEKGNKLIYTLYAQPAGKASAIWNFSLPPDIPDKNWGAADFLSDKMVRGFSYAVGRKYVFAFGGGTLFALDPQTGKLKWRHSVSKDPVIKQNAVSIDSAEMIEGSAGLFLTSRNALIRFDLTSMSAVSVLRKDLYEGPSPIIVDGAIYCFTQRN